MGEYYIARPHSWYQNASREDIEAEDKKVQSILQGARNKFRGVSRQEEDSTKTFKRSPYIFRDLKTEYLRGDKSEDELEEEYKKRLMRDRHSEEASENLLEKYLRKIEDEGV